MSEDDDFERPWTLHGEIRRQGYAIGRLQEYRTAREVEDKHLAEDVKKLTEAVAALQSTIDRSRGALWVISAFSGVMGAAAAAIAGAFMHSGPK